MSSVFKFFCEKATVEDLQRFCSLTGYRLVIFDNQNFKLVREAL